jgi:hypothetical protein
MTLAPDADDLSVPQQPAVVAKASGPRPTASHGDTIEEGPAGPRPA